MFVFSLFQVYLARRVLFFWFLVEIMPGESGLFFWVEITPGGVPMFSGLAVPVLVVVAFMPVSRGVSSLDSRLGAPLSFNSRLWALGVLVCVLFVYITPGRDFQKNNHRSPQA